MNRGCRVGSWALVAGLFAAGALRADYRVEFREGMKSFDRKNWPELEARMAAAVRENPKEDGRETIRLTGTFSKAYLPYFYLGLAQAEQGKCSDAVRSFARSESFGQIAGFREHADLVRLRDRCRAVAVRETSQRVEGLLRESDAARDRLAQSAARSSLGASWDGDAALGGEQRRLEVEVADLRTQLRALSSTPDLASADEVDRRAAALAPAWKNLASAAESRAARAPETVAVAPEPVQVAPEPTPAALAEAASPSSARIPAPLLEAVRFYFAGEYASCLTRLDQVASPEARLAPQVDLFRAAAQFALSRLDADAAERRLREARAAARRFAAAPGRSRPDPRHFPPDFLRFLAGG